MNTNLSRRFRKALSAIAILNPVTLAGGMICEMIGRYATPAGFRFSSY